MHPISPLDGRYARKVGHLGDLFSELGLMRARVEVEARYVLALYETGLLGEGTAEEKDRLAALPARFGEEEYTRIKEIEVTTNHDLKACITFLEEQARLGRPELIHFGLTSEDANNLAWSLLLDEYRRTRQLPQLEELLEVLIGLARRWRDLPFPARTHGQLASPTTAGKEIAVFLHRLLRQIRKLRAFRFSGKLNGATGNHSAQLAAFPCFDWLSFSRSFVRSLGLSHNPVTTQIEDHDTWAEYFDLVRRINNIVMDLDQDCWSYISRGYLVQRVMPDEVGSSTMPHKVNPISFENSEGNLVLSSSLLSTLSDRLCCSRMQRDLTDSTVQRNIGVALTHGWLAISETKRGLGRVELDGDRCREELDGAPELLSEPIQTMLKAEGVADAYDLMKAASRGAAPTRAELLEAVSGLPMAQETRERMEAMTVSAYLGDATRICDQVVEQAEAELTR